MDKAKKSKPNLAQKISSLEDQLKRSLADYANLQRRGEEEKKRTIEFANTRLLTEFIPVLDDLEASAKEIVSDGLGLVIKKFKNVLAREGVSEIDTSGSFDPTFHEAVEVVEGGQEGRILEVIQKGYILGGRVLRPAKVKVSKIKTPQAK